MKWQAPPTRNNGRVTDHQNIARALREKPGQWALVKEAAKSPSQAGVLRTSRAYSPSEDFEIVQRKREDGKYDVYARFVGGAA